jgi:hypothetical protein
MSADQEFEIQKIHETVWVFKNALKNWQEVINYLEATKEWTDWYTFGKHANATMFSLGFDEFPTKDEWEEAKHLSKEFSSCTELEHQINDLFYNATKLYVESNNIKLDNWSFQGWNVAKYHAQPEEDYAMMHHTDYQREYTHNPGSKFGITAVFYLNDNYEGGEVLFRFLDDDVSIVKEDYHYKPSAGDVVVFLSGHPHYHGVASVKSGEKYIVRTYWRYDYPGHDLWLKLQKKYGEAAWEQMESMRVRATRQPENVTVINNIPFFPSFEEYYKEEIALLEE